MVPVTCIPTLSETTGLPSNISQIRSRAAYSINPEIKVRKMRSVSSSVGAVSYT